MRDRLSEWVELDSGVEWRAGIGVVLPSLGGCLLFPGILMMSDRD